MVPGETEVELARIVALFFQDPPEVGLLNISVIQTPDGRIGKRLLFDSAESLRQVLGTCAVRRPALLKRAEAIADPASVPVMWIGPARATPDALWPSATATPGQIDDTDDGASWPCVSPNRSPPSSSSATATDRVVDMDDDRPLRTWPDAEDLFKFMTFWKPSAMERVRASPRRFDASGCTVLLTGLPGDVSGAGFFTRFVNNFSVPWPRLQHRPYSAAPLPRVSECQRQLTAPTPPLPPRRTMCLTATLEDGITVRCKFDSAVVGAASPAIGDRVLVRVPSTSPVAHHQHCAAADDDDVSDPSPVPPLRSATVKAVSSWSRKRAADARVPTVERFWSSPDDDDHELAHVGPLADLTLASAQNVLRDGSPCAFWCYAARAYHDLSGVVLSVCLTHPHRATRRRELELQLAHVAREVQYRVGVAVHWAPVVGR